jgi:hypothetical protein
MGSEFDHSPVSSDRMSGAIVLLLLYAFTTWAETTLPFNLGGNFSKMGPPVKLLRLWFENQEIRSKFQLYQNSHFYCTTFRSIGVDLAFILDVYQPVASNLIFNSICFF